MILLSLIQLRVQEKNSSFGPKQNTKVNFNHPPTHPPTTTTTTTCKVVPCKLGQQNLCEHLYRPIKIKYGKTNSPPTHADGMGKNFDAHFF
jgi:hypothetical protein